MQGEPAGMIDIRTVEGRLLFRASADGRTIQLVQRRRRYTVELANIGLQRMVFVVAQVDEESENSVDTNPMQT